MHNFAKKKTHQIIEVIFWILLILTVFIIISNFPWNVAQNILRALTIIALIVSTYFYLVNRRLFHEYKLSNEKASKKQKELHARQNTIDLIFNNATDGILILDQDKTIQEFSPGLEKITGYSRSEALGRNAQELLKFSAKTNHSLLPDMMFTINSKNKNQYTENLIVTKQGKIVDIEASHTLTQDHKTGEALALAIIRDETYEKAMIERDKEFITVTSHQLNTPLSIIKGYASLLMSGKGGELSEKQQKFAQEILNSTERMIELTNSILSISRIEQDKIKLCLDEINLKDLISYLANSLQSKAESKNLKIIVKPIGQNLIIMGDQEKLKQALSNFIENAIKYTEKGRITISVSEHQNNVEIMIADTGIGIPQQEIEKIGNRFYRSQNALNADKKGTGLGIYIAKTIIEKHHGRLNIQSREGEYTKIIVILPKNQNN